MFQEKTAQKSAFFMAGAGFDIPFGALTYDLRVMILKNCYHLTTN
jgi:hypothetical protein